MSSAVWASGVRLQENSALLCSLGQITSPLWVSVFLAEPRKGVRGDLWASSELLQRGTSLPWDKTRECVWAIFESVCFIPRHVIKNIIFLFSQKYIPQ